MDAGGAGGWVGRLARVIGMRVRCAHNAARKTSGVLLPPLKVRRYFDTFVNVTLALGLVFELPVLIFFLALLRLVTPQFLIRNSRYAILIIVIIAAIVTPTPDVINLMLISVPMAILYFAGVFATYLLWLSRENKRFPWALTLFLLLILGGLVAAALYVATTYYGYRLERVWPFLVR
jgi:sec-independent protein translocase protein TatC